MQTIEILSHQEAEELLSWCNRQQLETEIFSGKPTCRLKKWWGFEAEFYFSQSHVYERQPIESDPYLKELCDRFYKEATSVLLYRYEIGGEIGEHLDKQCFKRMVRMINLVDANADLFGEKPTTRFRFNRQSYHLRHGEVVTFDSRVLHSVPKVKTIRYSLQFREIA